MIDARGHALQVELPPEPVVLDGDPTRLIQVLGNLLNNAAKFSPPGCRIVVAASCEGGEVRISVRDTGIGIPADLIPKLFEMFRQGNPGPGQAQGGLGVGLALVKRLVEMHGGRVEARSSGPGQGSEFVVRLPLAGPAPPENRDPAAAEEHAARAPVLSPVPVSTLAPGPFRRILVVDDSRDAADMLAAVLRLRGAEVRTAYEGLEALRIAEEFVPHVALLDLGLPQLDGLDMARRIRREPWDRTMLLAAVTGRDREADRLQSQDAGFDYHLVKPLRAGSILDLLSTLPFRTGVSENS